VEAEKLGVITVLTDLKAQTKGDRSKNGGTGPQKKRKQKLATSRKESIISDFVI